MRFPAWIAAGALALALAAPNVARAQEEPPPPEDKNADWSALFERGLDLLRAKKIDESIKAFEACVKLFPDRAVAYYNIACGHSLAKRPKQACEWLEKAFARGFLDLSHIARDTDLDPIREDEGFKALLEKTKKGILQNRPAAARYVSKKAPAENRTLVVFLHADGSDLDALKGKLKPAADALGCVLLIPSGRRTDAQGAHWDTTAETCIVADVDGAVGDDELAIDPKKVVFVGEEDGATRLLSMAVERGWKRVVLGAGRYERIEPAKGKDLRAYVFTTSAVPALIEEAGQLRDGVLAAGGRIVIERHSERAAFPKDLAAAIERGVRWTLGEDVTIPGDGEVRKF